MLYQVLKVVAGPLLRVLFRPRVQGLEHVPAEGPAILAANHLSFSDSLFLPLVLPRPVVFIGKAEYFTGRGLKGRLSATFFRSVGTIPVDRSGGRAAVAALHTGRRVLEQGGLFGIYPEGTRSPDGRLYRGKTGVARLALGTKAPVIPCALVNTDEIQPPGAILPRRITRVEIRIGAPLDFSRYEGMEHDRYVLRAVTDEIMYAIMRLSGREYVDVYAARAKTGPARLRGTAARGPEARDASTPPRESRTPSGTSGTTPDRPGSAHA